MARHVRVGVIAMSKLECADDVARRHRLSFVVQLAVQGLIAKAVPVDEQGTIQGAITRLLSLTAIVGPIVATVLFSHFSAPEQTVNVPGAPFFSGAFLMLLAPACPYGAKKASEAFDSYAARR